MSTQPADLSLGSSGRKTPSCRPGRSRRQAALRRAFPLRAITIFDQHGRIMPNEDIRVALQTADQARTDFAIIEDDLEAIYARLARQPSRGDLWRVCLIGMLGGSVLTTALGLAFATVH
jgi:hypothetical protein